MHTASHLLVQQHYLHQRRSVAHICTVIALHTQRRSVAQIYIAVALHTPTPQHSTHTQQYYLHSNSTLKYTAAVHLFTQQHYTYIVSSITHTYTITCLHSHTTLNYTAASRSISTYLCYCVTNIHIVVLSTQQHNP